MAQDSAPDRFRGAGLEEEQQTMEERTGLPKGKTLDSTVLQEPITQLDLRAAAVCVEEETEVAEAIRLMQKHHIGCVLVQAKGVLVGIFTERDVIHKLLRTTKDLRALPVGAFMTPDPETLTMTDSIAFALHKMNVGGFRHIPLVDERQHPVGVVSVKDIVDYLAEFFPNEIMNLPPRPQLLHPGERDGG